MAAGDLLAPNLLLAFLAAVAKKYSRNVLKDPVDEAGAAAVAMATAAGTITASAVYNEQLFLALGLALFAVEAVWFAFACGEER